MESRRCAEHGLSFLPGFWGMLFSAGAGGEMMVGWDWDLHLASVIGIQMGSPDMHMQR
jgi:hypothetical protein